MKPWLWIVVLLLGAPLCARDKKFEGYVINPSALREVESYCVDTHNLPADQTRIIERFVSQATKPKGVLAKLPWHRLPRCQESGHHAIVRFEFMHKRPGVNGYNLEGALLVFRPGSPSPIYETQALPMWYFFADVRDRTTTEFLEQDALDSVSRILVHDWRHLH
jgi:hypothetical protein